MGFINSNLIFPNMKSESVIIISGIIMIIVGLILFYLIGFLVDLDPLSQYLKHSGLFIGLIGIGATMAGILLYLISKEEVPIQEDLDF